MPITKLEAMIVHSFVGRAGSGAWCVAQMSLCICCLIACHRAIQAAKQFPHGQVIAVDLNDLPIRFALNLDNISSDVDTLYSGLYRPI